MNKMSEELVKNFENLSIIKSETSKPRSILNRKGNIENEYPKSKTAKFDHPCAKSFIECIHSAGWRKTMLIEKKENYSLLEVLEIIERLDVTWESGKIDKK